MQASQTENRLAIVVSGVVQGVGFRPFVYALARRNALAGFVRNNNGAVQIEVQGSPMSLTEFLRNLQEQAPPLAEITHIDSSVIAVKIESGFRIDESSSNFTGHKLLPPDAATCNECLGELLDPANRRFRYPFINCTNCGPRFTIINSLPYDRRATTMAGFAMCALCQKEYDDPSDRRFHAEPIACPSCGPQLSWHQSDNRAGADDALEQALLSLSRGEIAAVKGLGGFHLVCDAENAEAIKRLRERKRRARKPFAVMMTDLEMVRRYCLVSPQEKSELLHPARPIVLLELLPHAQLPPEIAPASDRLGVMLPYTPLHHLLMLDRKRPIIATSANVSEEPIVIDNEEARGRLEGLADGFLVHNRDICSRYDDSIVHFVAEQKCILRRARGIAPKPLKLPFRATRKTLALGAHLKNSFCMIDDDRAFVSQHIGDLENLEAEQHLQQTLEAYMNLFSITPEIIAHDLHPDYVSSSLAQSLSQRYQVPLVEVQHHHAHIVACMIEHGLTTEAIGVAFDGLGLGTDGTLWGAEFLITRLTDFERLAHFEPVPMPGGMLAIRQPWRMTLSHIFSGSEDIAPFANFVNELENRFGAKTIDLTLKQIATKFNAPMVSSCGRLFDAVSALLGVCLLTDYEGQAAIELEALAHSYKQSGACTSSCYPYEIAGTMPYVIKPRAILRAAWDDLNNGVAVEEIAARFHYTVACMILEICTRVRASTRNSTVCLGGGVFQNRLLLSLTETLLEKAGFSVYFPQQVPANDGGLSLGQAVIAVAAAGAIVPTLKNED